MSGEDEPFSSSPRTEALLNNVDNLMLDEDGAIVAGARRSSNNNNQSGADSLPGNSSSPPRASSRASSTGSNKGVKIPKPAASSNDGSPRSGGRSFFSRIFRKDGEPARDEPLITDNGSIAQFVWDALEKKNSKRDRIRVLRRLQELMISKTLQVSSIEGIVHQSIDLVTDPDCRDFVIRAYISITQTQFDSIGIVLRGQFFDKIRTSELDARSLEWLMALTKQGTFIEGLEKVMDHHVLQWLKAYIDGSDPILAVDVFKMTINMVTENLAFVSEDVLREMLHICTVRAMNTRDALSLRCLEIIRIVAKKNGIPGDSYHKVVLGICFVLAIEDKGKLADSLRNDGWTVAQALMRSQFSCTARGLIQELLQSAPRFGHHSDRFSYSHQEFVQVIRGGVFWLAKSGWGVETMEPGSPTYYLSSLRMAMRADPHVCKEVIESLRALLLRYGRGFADENWRHTIHVLESADKLCKKDRAYEEMCRPVIYRLVHSLEEMDGLVHWCRNYVYDIVEVYGDLKEPAAVHRLIQDRISMVDIYSPRWVEELREALWPYFLAQKGLPARQNYMRREKSLQAIKEYLKQNKLMCEVELVERVVLPMLGFAPREPHPKIQALMISLLFEILKVIPVDEQCFHDAIIIARKLFNEGLLGVEDRRDRRLSHSSIRSFQTNLDQRQIANHLKQRQNSGSSFNSGPSTARLILENLEVTAQQLCAITASRFPEFPGNIMRDILELFVAHISTQYQQGKFHELGGSVRVRIFSAILSVQACPISHRIQRYELYDYAPTINSFTFLKGSTKKLAESKELSFDLVAPIIVEALRKETHWKALRSILKSLNRTLESIDFIMSCGQQNLDALLDGCIDMFERLKTLKVADSEIVIYLPQLLIAILNYPLEERRQREVCRILVECLKIKVGHHSEAIQSCGLAVQMLPEQMALYAHQILLTIRSLEPSPRRAIPVLELMSDTSGIEMLHTIFQEENFEMVVDILVPYLNIKVHSIYVVVCAHRILMRWFSKVPRIYRADISRYYEEKVEEALQRHASDSQKPNANGMEDEVDEDSPSNSLQGNTPPSEYFQRGSKGRLSHKLQKKFMKEIQTALLQFFRLGRISAHVFGGMPEVDGYEEVESTTYSTGDSIVTLRNMVKKGSRAIEQHDQEDRFSENITSWSSPHVDPDARRRHASAIQPSTSASSSRASIAEKREEQDRILRDLRAAAAQTPRTVETYQTALEAAHKFTPIPKVHEGKISVTQMIVRHMYGRDSWIMRRIDQPGFGPNVDGMDEYGSLSLHLSGLSGSKRIGPKKTNDLVSTRIRNLDRISGIELHPVGVIFMGSGQSTETDVLSNPYGTKRYEYFIKSLGTPQSTAHDLGGGLIAEKNGDYTYTHLDEISSMVFLIATLMPRLENDDKCNNKKKLIGNNVCCLVWNESGKRYQMGSLFGDFIHVVIEVVPVGEDSVRIEVHARHDIEVWMALRRALVPENAAPNIIRKLCIRAKLAADILRCSPKDLPYISSAVERLRKIQLLKDTT